MCYFLTSDCSHAIFVFLTIIHYVFFLTFQSHFHTFTYRWRVVRLESLATASREYGALQNMRHLTALGAALLHASPNPPPSKPISHQHHHHPDAGCVQEDALVSLSMRLMRESAAADLTANDNEDNRDFDGRAHEEGRMRDAANAGAAVRGASTTQEMAATKEPSALLRARADALSRTVCLCEGLFVNEALLRTEVNINSSITNVSFTSSLYNYCYVTSFNFVKTYVIPPPLPPPPVHSNV